MGQQTHLRMIYLSQKAGPRRGPALRGSGVGNRFEVVLVPAGVGGGQLLVDLFLLTASFLS